MEKASGMVVVMITIMMMITVMIIPARGADPDPLLDYCVSDTTRGAGPAGYACKASATSADFGSAILKPMGNTNNSLGIALGVVAGANLGGLNTQGLAFAKIDYAQGGLVPPHVHPRSSEIIYVLRGKILNGFVTTSNEYFYQETSAGEVFVFPRGLVHYSVNVGSSHAVTLSAFNSQNPGVGLVASNLFASQPEIPDFVLQKTFSISQEVVDSIKSAFKG